MDASEVKAHIERLKEAYRIVGIAYDALPEGIAKDFLCDAFRAISDAEYKIVAEAEENDD